ncbi:hypothetical protein AMTRI_Chr06g170940 [Amborella trichopoda]|uniref:RING-type E3 ubiquitin transferase n=1 Tax=Amborella trichopoda TaxID=13333 RepID=W1PGB3_AMBTC|nr:E3 ubiquitin-protein ligase ORTHRUS 2 [Amborella trichopoda]ERN06135.1 hypothetical protein AMTR_s00016p00085910 [Amborella trichopoda]|eukprot:XP_006844460.1 E3 ubiquitin-protein ligase ORTHRUS 2 [Amborella trichopoda]
MAEELPCDGDGMCMACKKTPPEADRVVCNTCGTPWHIHCLSNPPDLLAQPFVFECPDCSLPPLTGNQKGKQPLMALKSDGLISSIRAIQEDQSLSDREKARLRQQLMSSPSKIGSSNGDNEEEKNEVLGLLDETLNCCFCMQLLDRPVTTPCGHNFCLKCFQKWVGQGKRTCAKCRNAIPSKMVSQPRINSAMVVAIRMAKLARTSNSSGAAPKVYYSVRNENRPDKPFTTERAKKAGKANACSGKIFVTIAPDHFGPILAENDPERGQGVLVGESWEDRMECRQWGAHLPHVAGIAGQSDYGAQSVALSGGYEDDEDHGEWFLYTGSGGRDLSGNKRTNKEHSFDQKFDKSNEALRLSCKKGYPVRVVRSHKEKRSCYAPESGVRYDGIYRIEKCWRKVGIQGFKVCRYLFVRCDNDPAPWTSDEHGDRPRPLPTIKELSKATDITERKEKASWDWEEGKGWHWARLPPPSRKSGVGSMDDDGRRVVGAAKRSRSNSAKERLLKEFGCQLCRKVMTLPLTTPCAHNFCKECLEGAFAGQSFVRERTTVRSLRAQKIVKKCPSCQGDITDFLQNPQVNRELKDVIETLQRKFEEEEGSNAPEDDNEEGEDGGKPEDTLKEEKGEGMSNSDNMESPDNTNNAEPHGPGSPISIYKRKKVEVESPSILDRQPKKKKENSKISNE